MVGAHSGQGDRREAGPLPWTHWSGQVGLDGRAADGDAGGVDTSMNPERAGGYVLLVAAVTGAVLGPKAPQRWGRAGGGLLLAGLSALLARDIAMVASGTPRRLRPLPRALLFAETVCAAMGIALGARPWLMADPPQPVAPTGRAGSGLATATFTIHAIRQVIYLSPGQGRSGPRTAPLSPDRHP
jgi:hypothetical protein